jgi:hypothetical protein
MDNKFEGSGETYNLLGYERIEDSDFDVRV